MHRLATKRADVAFDDSATLVTNKAIRVPLLIEHTHDLSGSNWFITSMTDIASSTRKTFIVRRSWELTFRWVSKGKLAFDDLQAERTFQAVDMVAVSEGNPNLLPDDINATFDAPPQS